MRLAKYLIAGRMCIGAFAQSQAVPTFGTTVVVPGGLVGVVYYIQPFSMFLPDFRTLHPVGVIYTASLNVPPRDFREGFPGVTDRFEWFAIDYRGRFWIQEPGVYQFALTSDDGAKLYIDDELAINNDGIHPPAVKMASLRLEGGIHHIRVSYFQGPRDEVALILRVAPPGKGWQVFSTDEFKPPPNPETWDYPSTRDGMASVVPRPQLQIGSVAGAPGGIVSVEVRIKWWPPEKELVAMDWELIVPAQLLQLVGDPEIGRAAADSDKVLRCSATKRYLYDCRLDGGEKPIPDGPIAVFAFELRAEAQSRTAVLRIEKVEAVTSDRRKSTLDGAEGIVAIH